jgi:tRNA-specific 2-thiouridylase
VKRVVVAMSGGVDSSVAAALMKQQGYEVLGVTMTLAPHDAKPTPGARGCCSVWDVNDAERVADQLGIPHYSFNLRDEFQQHVIDDFVAEYARGRTPNPCRRCNQHIKFDHLLRRALDLGAEKVVTGHYARIVHDVAAGCYRLLQGQDPRKDQSYVLATLTQQQLSQSLFPIGELEKSRVRELARELGLGVADKAESQDLCFIPDGDTQGFLDEHIPNRKEGAIVDRSGQVLGQHDGLTHYTVGQRRGLGMGGPSARPRYVLELDVRGNTLVVGDADELLHRQMRVEELNWIQPGAPERAVVKYRSTTPGAPAQLRMSGSDALEVEFESAQRALTPGQVAVFYDGSEVLGGGTISEVK